MDIYFISNILRTHSGRSTQKSTIYYNQIRLNLPKSWLGNLAFAVNKILMKNFKAKTYWEKMYQQIYLIRESQIERKEKKL